MFISIALDLVSPDSEEQLANILKEYGIKKIQKNVYESFEFATKRLGNLKKDIADCLDMDDKLRIYQFPLENSFKISYIEDRKWKRLSVSV